MFLRTIVSPRRRLRVPSTLLRGVVPFARVTVQYPRCCFPPHELVVIFDIGDTAVVVVMGSIIINAQISMLKETFVVCVFRLDSQPKSLVVVTFKNRERNTLARFDRQTNVVLTNHPTRRVFPSVKNRDAPPIGSVFGSIHPSIRGRTNPAAECFHWSKGG